MKNLYTQDEFSLLSNLIDKIHELNEVIKDYLDYMILEMEEEAREVNDEYHPLEIPF